MYLGICVAGILTLWFASSVLKGNDPLIEGLDNKSGASSITKLEGSKLTSMSKRLQTELNLTEDMAGLSKYRSKWEDLIVDMEKVAQLGVLESLMGLASNPPTKETHALVERCNSYSQLATVTLPAAMSFVDNYTPSSSSGNGNDDTFSL